MNNYMLHPREVKYHRYWERRLGSNRRLPPGVLGSSQPRTDRPLWMDYFPWAPGTVPEKMLFAELAKRQVTFFFGAFWGDSPFTVKKERLRPDFLLPEYRIIIEVMGTYWHTRPGSAERDANHVLQYEAAGYKVYQIWDWEIYKDPAGALNQIPELVSPVLRTGKIFVAERPFDPTASLRAQRRAHPRVIRLRVAQQRGARKIRARAARKLRLASPKKLQDRRAGSFEGFTDATLAKYRTYGQQWKKYIADLNQYFGKNPNAKISYQAQYQEALQWKDWWGRWQSSMANSTEWQQYIGRLGTYFQRYPSARGRYQIEYYRWLTWRSMGYRRL